MLQRISFGSMAVALLLVVVAADALVAYEWQQFGPIIGAAARRGSVIPLVFTALMLAAAREFIRLMRSIGLRPHAGWAMLMAGALTLSPWLYAAGSPAGNRVGVEGLICPVVGLIVAVLGTSVFQLLRLMKERPVRFLTVQETRFVRLEVRTPATERSVGDIGATLLLVVYCGFLPSFLVLLRCDDKLPTGQGAWLILVVLAITKASDMGAYFTGSAVGRHKLMPTVSPGKSVEGAFGGLGASLLVGILLWYFSGIAASRAASPSGDARDLTFLMQVMGTVAEILETLGELSLSQVIVFSLVMSASGQLGDLLESVFKRAAHAKDSAALIPSFGGVLDVVDSPVLAAPVAWFLLTHGWEVV